MNGKIQNFFLFSWFHVNDVFFHIRVNPNLIYPSTGFIKICCSSLQIKPYFVSVLGERRNCPLRLKVNGKKKHPCRKFYHVLEPFFHWLLNFSLFSVCVLVPLYHTLVTISIWVPTSDSLGNETNQ